MAFSLTRVKAALGGDAYTWVKQLFATKITAAEFAAAQLPNAENPLDVNSKYNVDGIIYEYDINLGRFINYTGSLNKFGVSNADYSDVLNCFGNITITADNKYQYYNKKLIFDAAGSITLNLGLVNYKAVVVLPFTGSVTVKVQAGGSLNNSPDPIVLSGNQGDEIVISQGPDADMYNVGTVSSDRYMIANNRSIPALGRSNATYNRATEIAMKSPPYDISSPRFCFAAWVMLNGKESNLGNILPLQAVSIKIGSTITALTFGGQASINIPDGEERWTDANNLVIPANTEFLLISADGPYNTTTPFMYCPGGQYYPKPSVGGAGTGGDAVAVGSTSQAFRVANGLFTIPTNYGSGALWGPTLMVAKGWLAAGKKPVGLLIGDSIGAGTTDIDSVYATDQVFGFVARGLHDNATTERYPHANYCVGGAKFTMLTDANTTDDSNQGNFSRRKRVLKSMGYPFTFSICQMGKNSLGTAIGATDDDKNIYLINQAKAAHKFIKSMGNRKLIQTTITFGSNSNNESDGSANNYKWSDNDPAHQVRMSAVQADALTAYFLASPDLVNAVIDVQQLDQINTGAGKGKIKAGTFTATLASASTAGTTTLMLDTKPDIGEVFIIDAGLSTFNICIVKDSQGASAPYTVTTKSTVSNAHAAGAAIVALNTTDGTHRTQKAHIALSAAVVAAKSAGVFN